jgi:hypothetical protein
MPAILNQAEQTSNSMEFVKSHANGEKSFEKVTVISGQVQRAGTVMGRITASGKFTILAPAAGDGSQVVAGVLCYDVDATGADQIATIMARDGEVVEALLTFPGGITGPQLVTAKANLNTLGIFLR